MSDKLESVVLEILRLQLPFQYLIKAVLTVNLCRFFSDLVDGSSTKPSTDTINRPSTVVVNPCKPVDSGSRFIFLKTACLETPISSAISLIVLLTHTETGHFSAAPVAEVGDRGHDRKIGVLQHGECGAWGNATQVKFRCLKRADVNIMCDWVVTLPKYQWHEAARGLCCHHAAKA